MPLAKKPPPPGRLLRMQATSENSPALAVRNTALAKASKKPRRKPRRAPPPPGRILRMEATCEFSGLSRSQILFHIKRGDFPRPVKITRTGKAIGFYETELIAWRDERLAARDAK
jgi:prophage regulatory protein